MYIITILSEISLLNEGIVLIHEAVQIQFVLPHSRGGGGGYGINDPCIIANA